MSQENGEIARQVLHAFSDGDLAGVLALCGSDIEWRPAVLGGGLLERTVYRGHGGMREFLRVQGETWETIKAVPRATRVVGDLVLVEVELQGVGRTSGASVTQTTWNVIRLRDGKIVWGEVFVHQSDALEAAGLSE